MDKVSQRSENQAEENRGLTAELKRLLAQMADQKTQSERRIADLSVRQNRQLDRLSAQVTGLRAMFEQAAMARSVAGGFAAAFGR